MKILVGLILGIRRIKSILESDQFKNTRFILIRVHDKDYMRAAKEVIFIDQFLTIRMYVCWGEDWYRIKMKYINLFLE